MQHLSKELWTALDGQRGLVHIETSMDSESAGRHICSIPSKGNERVIALVELAPELLNLAYLIKEGVDIEEIKTLADSLVSRSSSVNSASCLIGSHR